MRLKTIWTLPAATLGERLRRTGDWLAQTTAARLPARVRYWAFIHVSVRAIGDRVVTQQSFTDVLARAAGGPR